MDRTADGLGVRGGYEVLVQDRLPRPELLAEFGGLAGSALFATMGFWQGVDLPGHLCRLVAIDRIPFPRPTDPLVAGPPGPPPPPGGRTTSPPWTSPPRTPSSPRAPAGSSAPPPTPGVVAVFDRRLATKSYRQTLLATLPPLRRTIDPSQPITVLGALRDAQAVTLKKTDKPLKSLVCGARYLHCNQDTCS